MGIDESVRSTNYEAKKRKGKKENYSLDKSETNLYKMKCGLMWKTHKAILHSLYIKKKNG